MKVLVIGAGGFLGRHLCATLAAEGVEVVPARSSDGSGIDPDTGLLPDSFSPPRSTTAVVYLAQSPHTASMPTMAAHLLAVNALTPVRAALAARAAGITRFIYASTGTVYQPRFSALRESDPVRRDSWYSLSKIHAEEALGCLQGDMDVTSMRIFGLYGRGQVERLVPKLADSIAAGRPISLERPGNGESDGGLRISLLNVYDATRIVLALIGQRDLPVVNVASDEALSIREICETIGARLGAAPIFREAPQPRLGNMVADITLLRRFFASKFMPFRSGIADLVEIASNAAT